MPTLRLGLDSRLVEGLLMAPEAFDEKSELASCFVYVSSESRAWPVRESVVPVLEQFGYPEPSDGAFQRLAGMRDRSELLGRWTSERDEVVSIYALRAP
jgi:hypothetical protein